MHTQLAVLGGGPGGYTAAFLAADLGAEVTLVEADPRLGGTCLLRGCIPSKALLHVAFLIGEIEQLAGDWGVSYQKSGIDLDKLRQRKNQIIATLSAGLKQLARRRNVRVVHARGVLQDAATLRLEGDDPSIPDDRLLTFDSLILATGSLPARPPILGVDSPRVFDSTGALELPDLPGSLLVVGGGYIGLELGTVYARLGTAVSVVELTEGLLPGVDRDLVRPLEKRLHRLFDGRIYLNTRLGSIARDGDKFVATFEGPGKFGVERFDRVLVATGRRPATSGLGLEKAGVRVDERGFVRHDGSMRTDNPRIWVIGDAAGEPMLAHKAVHEARVAVESILGEPAAFDKVAIPAVVFTDPEIAWTGLTEEAAKREQVPYEVFTYPWAASGRAQAIGRTEGLTKWLVDPASQRLLGCGIVGPGAGELISEATLAIEMGCEVRDVADTIHPHPTLSETLMNAAELFFGTATEIYKPRRVAQESS
ncbi:MAG: dihydrolipoyl dehydrogenase [Pirellulaceae bacterium]|nr:MAG: dihydrolipoyl dehydrogenase [Pirellulaceae bacterium]